MKLPPARSRPKFAHWRFERGLTLRKTAELLNGIAGFDVCSRESVRTICLPFDDPDRTEPCAELAAAVMALTSGEIGDRAWLAPERAA